jgi:hypothetical protein
MSNHPTPQYHRAVSNAIGTVWECTADPTSAAVRAECDELVKAGKVVLQRTGSPARARRPAPDNRWGWIYAIASGLLISFVVGAVTMSHLFPNFDQVGLHPIVLLAIVCALGASACAISAALFIMFITLFGYQGR